MNLIDKLFHFSKKKKLLSSSEKDDINYQSLFTSMEKGQQLFNKLKIKCHPDRFVGTEREVIAESIFKEVQRNKTNYYKLVELENRIERELYHEQNKG